MKSVDDLLTDWEDRSARGETPTAEDLCADYPQHLQEVRRQIQALQSFASRFGVQLDQGFDQDESRETTAPPERSIRITTEYQLERLHAVGGLGSVYLAKDAGLNRRVALKFPRGKRHSEIIRIRFEREARITSRLDHPGIVPVHAILSDDQGQLCYAMRFIEGDTLQAAIDRLHGSFSDPRTVANMFRSLEFRDLLRRFQAVCNIAAYAHSQGVIHRDIKPSNIMLGAYGETLLVDWGLAKLDQPLDERPSPDHEWQDGLDPAATRLGDSIGTPAFASPEQLQGHHERVSSQSDVYSLGATLFYLLTGKHLLSNCDLPKHLDRVARNQLPQAREFLKVIPAALNAICGKAIAVTPADRYRTPQELARDLESYMSDEPISIPCDGWRVRTGRWLRKHPVAVAVTLATIAVGLIAAVASSLVLSDKNAKLDKANRELTYSYLELSKAWGAKSQLQMQLDQSRVTSAQLLKALTSLGDLHTSTFPNHTHLITASDSPFLEKLLERYLAFAGYSGDSQERRYIRAMGAWHSGSLLLALGRLPEAEAHLIAARKDLLILQTISLVPAMDQCTAQCCLQLAECRQQIGHRELALENTREALARLNKLLEPGRSGIVRSDVDVHRAAAICSLLELSANASNETELLKLLAEVRASLDGKWSHPANPLDTGLMLIRVLRQQVRTEPTQSRALLERAVTVCEVLLRDNPSHRRVRWELARVCGDLAQEMSQGESANPERALLAASRGISLLLSLQNQFPTESTIRSALAAAVKQRSQLRQAQGLGDLAGDDLRLAEEIASSAASVDLSQVTDGLGTEPLDALAGHLSSPSGAPLPLETFQKRQDLIESLEQLRERYVREGNLEHAIVTWEREQRLRRDARLSVDQEQPVSELEQGLSPNHWIIEDGDITFIETAGHAGGTVWGSGPYTDDSDLSTAALHSGHLKSGEFKIIAIRRHSGISNYTGSESNGVKTAGSHQYCGGYEVVASVVSLGEYNNVVVYRPEIKTVDVLVTGDSSGTVIGTDLYAISSDLPAVAVHQGLLKHGERGIIHVEFLPPQDSYTPSTRNGVTSGTLINWPGTIRVRRVSLADGDQSESN